MLLTGVAQARGLVGEDRVEVGPGLLVGAAPDRGQGTRDGEREGESSARLPCVGVWVFMWVGVIVGECVCVLLSE